MKTSIICEKYPASYNLILDYPEMDTSSYIETLNLTVSISPCANCQTFSIGQAGSIANIKDANMDDFIRLLLSTTGKYQLMIDLVNTKVKPVLDKLKPYISWKEKISYTNRTETPMTLFLIRFDEDKIMELYKNKPK